MVDKLRANYVDEYVGAKIEKVTQESKLILKLNVSLVSSSGNSDDTDQVD